MEPETAFPECRTAEKVRAAFASLGLSCRTEQAITGLTADVRGRSDEATIALMGELDAILLPDYPYADKATGAAHVCGHNVQLGALYGAAIGLVNSGAMRELDGTVRLMAVPAEEGINISGREALIRAGKIKTFNGKQEFIRLGLFDGVKRRADAAYLAGRQSFRRRRGRAVRCAEAHALSGKVRASGERAYRCERADGGANRSGRGRPHGTPIA